MWRYYFGFRDFVFSIFLNRKMIKICFSLLVIVRLFRWSFRVYEIFDRILGFFGDNFIILRFIIWIFRDSDI